MKCPSWAEQWKVDEVIECLSFGDAREQVERELMAAMPDAYASHPDDPDGEAGRNEWPEADSHADRKLSRVWSKLTPATQEAIDKAYQAEHGD